MRMVAFLAAVIALSLTSAGIARLIGKSLIQGRFSVLSLLYLMALVAATITIYLASRQWWPGRD